MNGVVYHGVITNTNFIKFISNLNLRAVFNRIDSLGLTVKRMKFIFKKFLVFEKVHGNEDTVEKVKELAAKYVESNGAAADNDNHDKSDHMEASLKKNLNIV